MNLLLVRACPNHCPYCFEADERRRGVNELSLDLASQMARWTLSARLRSLSLLGGEPFLHPHLDKIVRIFRSANPEMELTIFTGGLIDELQLDRLSPDDVGLMFNINEPSDYQRSGQYRHVVSIVKGAIGRGFNVTCGFNVWRSDFDPLFFPRFVFELGRTSFRWTVANPRHGAPTNVVQPAQYADLALRCVAMLKEATRLGIRAYLDCPLPLCFFEDSELSWISRHHRGTASRLGVCDPPIDITPELDVIRCFALSHLERARLCDFSNEKAVRSWFVRKVDSYLLDRGLFPRCSNCNHFLNSRCHGGCLGWHGRDAPPRDDSRSIPLTKRLYDLVACGNSLLALAEYEASSVWDKTALASCLAGIAASNLGR